jgi:hypothetical protein
MTSLGMVLLDVLLGWFEEVLKVYVNNEIVDE